MNKDNFKINLIGIYLFLILMLFILGGTINYFVYFSNNLIRTLIFICCSGGIGGTIYTIRGYYQNIGEEKFNLKWTPWYLFRPIISSVIGVFVYF